MCGVQGKSRRALYSLIRIPGELEELHRLTNFTDRSLPKAGDFGGLTVTRPVSLSAFPIGSVSSKGHGGEGINSSSLLSSNVVLLVDCANFPSFILCCDFLGVVSFSTILIDLQI